MLGGAQMLLAQATRIQEFHLDTKQNELLAEATKNVLRHFPSVLTAKQQDFMTLISTVAVIGYTQYNAYNARLNNEAAKKEPPKSSPITLRSVMDGAFQS